MRVIVLGAGLLGVTSAYYLLQQGHEVTVIDRQATTAAETSFANGGQISVCHAEPWANPGAPLQMLRWLGREDAPLLFRLRADRHQWLWGLQFLRECTPARARRNLEQLLRLGTYSRGLLQILRAATGIEYAQRTQGILHFYTSHATFDSAQTTTARMRELGCERRVLTVNEAVQIEPALRSSRAQLVGATYTAQDESGDAHRFTVALAELCRNQGARFSMNHRVTALRVMGGDLDHVEVTDANGGFARLRADAYVLALGSFSPLLAPPLGFRLPTYPAKRHSVTLTSADEPTRGNHESIRNNETTVERCIVLRRIQSAHGRAGRIRHRPDAHLSQL